MYCKFFGFAEKPFVLTPDPKYLYLNKAYSELLSTLFYGVQNKRGFIMIIGDVGTGKTTLLNGLMDRLDKKTKVAFIFNTDISFKQILIQALSELGLTLSKKRLTMGEALQHLNKFSIQQSRVGGNVVLIIDEAQNLSKQALENLRLISNIETRRTKLIQILLSGQPKLDYKLNRPELRHLFQRISVKRYIMHLSEEDTYAYIEHRLKICGYKGPAIFSEDSLKWIWKNTGGVPRKINMLCENSLIIGYATETTSIGKNIVMEAIRQFNYNPFKNMEEKQKYPFLF
jgi:general secretion pathway protein A